MSFHLIVSRRAGQVEKVVGRTEIELKSGVPVPSQFGLRCLDVYGLRIALRDKQRCSFLVAEPLDPFLRSFSSSCSRM